MVVFLGVKLLLLVTPALIGLTVGAIGLVPLTPAVLVGGCFGILGMIGPSFWLDHKKAQRQLIFRRALPDALDILVICLEGGLSLPGSLKRVASELRTATRPWRSNSTSSSARSSSVGPRANPSSRWACEPI